jgi:PD-(D/E)XK endonuclease
MTDNGSNIHHPKARGEWAELRFMARASERGLYVAKPWGDTAPYDLAVDHRGRFLRVQVKCTQHKRWNSYRCRVDANGIPYSPAQIDFIAAYVIPVDVWYILPVTVTCTMPEILLSPHRQKSKYNLYKEAWHLLEQ